MCGKSVEILSGANLDEQALIKGLEDAKAGKLAARSVDTICITL